MAKIMISRSIIVISLIIIFSIATPKIYCQTKIRWQETKFNLNLNGSIGIGFYGEPTGEIDGGLGINLDIIFLNLKFMNLGISSGILSLTNSIAGTENTVTCTFPINAMIIRYFRPRGWEIFPYIHLSPGVYLKTDLIFYEEITQDTSYTITTADPSDIDELKFGPGFSTGAGVFFALSKSLFLNCDIRFHLLRVDKDLYNILSNSIGLSLHY